MKMSLLAVITLFSALSINSLYCATFKVFNKTGSTIKVAPMWSGRSESYDQIGAGGSQRYDSGIQSPTAIRWHGDIRNKGGEVCYKQYEAGIKMWNLNLGAEFDVLNNGDYAYRFGIDGSSSGTAHPFN